MDMRTICVALALASFCTQAQAGSAQDIRSVDFKNATIDLSGSVCASSIRAGHIRLLNGTAQVGNAEIDARLIGFARPKAASTDIAVVQVSCQPDTSMNDPDYIDLLHFYAVQNGELRRLKQDEITFRDAREIVWGVRTVELQGHTIVVKSLSGLPRACPPHMIVRRLDIDGGAWKTTKQPSNLGC